jgi:hypothetical protein
MNPTETPVSPLEAVLEKVLATPAEPKGEVTDTTTGALPPVPASLPSDDTAEASGEGEDTEALEAAPEGEEAEAAEEPEAEAEAEEDTAALKESLAKHGARLEDVPEEARPLVEKRLKEMNAAFTRAQQEATTFRAEKAQYEAQVAYERQNPVDAIIHRLQSDPLLLSKVNEELERLNEPVYAQAKDIERQTNQKLAILEAENQRRRTEFLETRVMHVEHLAESVAASEGIPFALVEGLVAAAIATSPKGDITDEEVKQIVKQAADPYRRSIGAHKREAKKSLAKQKVQDRKTAGLTVKPGSASAPTPPPKKLPAAASSFADRTEARLQHLGVPE